jgi:hypothetical protein
VPLTVVIAANQKSPFYRHERTTICWMELRRHDHRFRGGLFHWHSNHQRDRFQMLSVTINVAAISERGTTVGPLHAAVDASTALLVHPKQRYQRVTVPASVLIPLNQATANSGHGGRATT